MEKKRKVTITLPLEQVAKDLGESLEADPFDDVFHNGYKNSDIKKMNLDLSEDLEGVDRIFPAEVSCSLEDEERNAIVRAIIKKRKNTLVDILEKINPGVVEYQDGSGSFVSIDAGILSAQLNDDETISIEILNPEHLINGILCGEGMFGPELETDEPASNETLAKYFHHLIKYFDIYGDSKPSSELSSHEQGDFDSESFESDLKERLENLTKEEVAERVMELDKEDALNLEEVTDLVTRLTSVNMEEVKQHILQSLQDDTQRWKSILK